MCEELVERYFETQVSCKFQIKDSLHRYHQCTLRKRTHHHGFHSANQAGFVYSYKGEFVHDFNPREFAWSSRVLEHIVKYQSSIGNLDYRTSRHGWTGGHQDCVRRFFNDIGGAELYKSQVTCLCCLSNPPEHHLPCEHVICTLCAIDFGRIDGLGQILVDECPLCGGPESNPFKSAVVIRQPPPFSGQRILVLDGYGNSSKCSCYGHRADLLQGWCSRYRRATSPGGSRESAPRATPKVLRSGRWYKVRYVGLLGCASLIASVVPVVSFRWPLETNTCLSKNALSPLRHSCREPSLLAQAKAFVSSSTFRNTSSEANTRLDLWKRR